MIRSQRFAGHRLLAAGALAACLALLAPAVPARAASVSFGTPTAVSTFGQGIAFNQPVSGGSGVARVELAIDFPGAIGPDVTQIADPGATDYRYELDASQGQLQPNTKLVARWRVTFADGSEESGPDVRVTYADDRFKWNTKTSQLVTLHWYQGNDAFADKLMSLAEQGIQKAESLLGASEASPVDFFVYADQQTYLEAVGPAVPDYSAGTENSSTRTMFAVVDAASIGSAGVTSGVPHELTHLVFDDATDNPYNRPPYWLNEGVAVYVSDGYSTYWRGFVSDAIASNILVPLQSLRNGFPRNERAYNTYGEAVSAVDYMVRKYGKAALAKLVKAYSSGASDDEAFDAGFGLTAAAFDKAWMADNGVTSFEKFGPQPAPAGPLPPGWTGSAPAATSAPGASGGGPAPVRTAVNGGSSPLVTKTSGDDARQVLLATGGLVGLAIVVAIVALLVARRSRQSGGPG